MLKKEVRARVASLTNTVSPFSLDRRSRTTPSGSSSDSGFSEKENRLPTEQVTQKRRRQSSGSEVSWSSDGSSGKHRRMDSDGEDGLWF